MSKDNLSDKSLFKQLQQQDKQAFLAAYDLYLDDIFRFILFKVNDVEKAEDITSTVFLKVWDCVQNNRLKDHKTLKPFLYKVARNLVIDYYRTKSRQPEISYHHDPDSLNLVSKENDFVKQLSIASDFGQVEKKLLELKDEYREVIILRYVNELSVAEIAATLEKNRGNVSVLLFRALKALREITKEEKGN